VSATKKWHKLKGLLRFSSVCCLFATEALFGPYAAAQTSCSDRYTTSGVFICYPNPAENIEDSPLPDIFHLSAQGNAAEGHEITRFTVLMDNRVIVDNKLPLPLRSISVETNLKSPFDSGSHTLRLVIDGAGSAEVKGLQLSASKDASFCDPFNRVDRRACKLLKIRGPLRWSLTESNPQTPDSLEGYFAYQELYGRNLKSVEADVADAIAVDRQGNLYVASHSFADVELRKYTPTGSIAYDSLIRSCGDGFLSVTGLAIDHAGHAWIAGNTTACLPATPDALQAHAKAGSMRGFAMLIDTAKPTSSTPLYVTYLADVDHRIEGLRVDGEGRVYLAGNTTSLEFPHQGLLDVSKSPGESGSTQIGFVSVLNPSGSALEWSTLVRPARFTSLALDNTANIYVTGRSGTSALIAELSDRGQRISYLARFGGSTDEEGRAISISATGRWVFVTAEADAHHEQGLQSFAVALEPCQTGILYTRPIPEKDRLAAPEIALAPALDAFSNAFSGTFAAASQKAVVSIAPACSSIAGAR
jgi:hypothetical protein